MKKRIEDAFYQLKDYVEKENFKGYDPYDTLNAKIPLKHLGKWPAAILTQIQKRNPINVRPLLGINKEINPKAFGIFLNAYSLLYQSTHNDEYLKKADYFYDYLKNNYSKGYSGYAWGYNFPWASPVKFVDAYVPSSVVTGFVIKGFWQYYKVCKKQEIVEIILSASEFILKDLSVFADDSGKCISYTPVVQDICYNSSLLATEVLAINYSLIKESYLKDYCIELVNFVISRQKENGMWNYSEDISTGVERIQIDFHQGYVLESIYDIQVLLEYSNQKWNNAIEKGMDFYYKNQFYQTGQSLFRLPKVFPVEIHNQSQGIITFTRLAYINPEYQIFAEKILSWTIENMKDRKGFYYYKKYKFITDKTSYMRWSQAWMFLALTYFIRATSNYSN